MILWFYVIYLWNILECQNRFKFVDQTLSDFLWIPELSQDKVDWYQLFFSRYLNIAKVFIVYEHFYLEKRFNGALEGWEKDERKVLSLTKTIELWIIGKKSFAVSDDPLWWPFLKSVTRLHFPQLEMGSFKPWWFCVFFLWKSGEKLAMLVRLSK